MFLKICVQGTAGFPILSNQTSRRLQETDIVLYLGSGMSQYADNNPGWVLVFSKYGLCEVYLDDLVPFEQ